METKFRYTLSSLNNRSRYTVNNILLKYYNFLVEYDYKADENLYDTYRTTFENLCEQIKTNEAMYEILNQIYRDCCFIFFPAKEQIEITDDVVRETFINITNMLISISKCTGKFDKS